MGRFFAYLTLVIAVTLTVLFFPIVLENSVHYDMNKKKFAFSVYAYKIWKIFGGYVTTYKGGFALHVSKKKALLKPYSGLDKDRKRFSFVRTFKVKALSLTTETGAEYLLPVSVAHTVLKAVFLAKGGDHDRISNRLWLTDGDVLRVTMDVTLYFNLYILLRAFLYFLKEKVKELWWKENKKSTT